MTASAREQTAKTFARARQLIRERGDVCAVAHLLELLRACHDISTAGYDSELANKVREALGK